MMNKYLILMLFPMLANADLCDIYFDKVGTTINNYDTTEWLEYNSDMGFWCDLDFATDRPSNPGDFAYFYNEFETYGNPNPLAMKHKFTIVLKDSLRSFGHGDRMSIFQVRADNKIEDRLLNVHLVKQVDTGERGTVIAEYWNLKVVWFRQVGDSFQKTVTIHNLGNLGTSTVGIEYGWKRDDYDYIKINGVQHNSPYVLPIEDKPYFNRMGYINANTQLTETDVLPFLEVVPQM
jgi:hypothetical protein